MPQMKTASKHKTGKHPLTKATVRSWETSIKAAGKHPLTKTPGLRKNCLNSFEKNEKETNMQTNSNLDLQNFLILGLKP